MPSPRPRRKERGAPRKAGSRRRKLRASRTTGHLASRNGALLLIELHAFLSKRNRFAFI